MKAVIVGSTGLVGSHLVQKLLADASIERVTSISRRSIGSADKKLTEVLLPDLDQLESVQAKLSGDLYFCCLGSTIKAAGSRENFRKIDFDAIFDFAKIAKAHKAKAFGLVSSAGADSDSKFFYNEIKGQTEEAVKSLNMTSLTIYRPGLLMGKRHEFRPVEKVATLLIKPLSLLMPKGLQRRITTDAELLATVMRDDAKKAEPGRRTVEAAQIV